MTRWDVVVVGGGIVGVATARALGRSGARVLVLEAEDRLAAHQTGHNSGVIHSGLYYRPGSLKARLCTAGREALVRFCEERGIAHERCGKVVVATRPEHLPTLEMLEARGQQNGLEGLRRLSRAELAEREPHVSALAALLVPQTGIVDFPAVTRALAADVRQGGGEVRERARVLAIERRADAIVVETAQGAFEARGLVNCAGLESDRVARLAGDEPDVRIVPFRGEYLELRPEARHLVRHLVYPVPDPRFPFLGVHFTRMVDGAVEAGPNAVLALSRRGYSWREVDLRDIADTLSWPGFWRLVRRWWRFGLGETWRSLVRGAAVRALQELVPEVRAEDLQRGRAGVRAQALDRRGHLLDDFRIVEAERAFHVLNAPSPAATAALAIGDEIARRARAHLRLDEP